MLRTLVSGRVSRMIADGSVVASKDFFASPEEFASPKRTTSSREFREAGLSTDLTAALARYLAATALTPRQH